MYQGWTKRMPESVVKRLTAIDRLPEEPPKRLDLNPVGDQVRAVGDLARLED